jgi:hypothetical protein
MATINIYRNHVWAGAGRLDNGTIVDCPAVLGSDQDESDEVYEMIEDAIADGDDEVGEWSWVLDNDPAAVRRDLLAVVSRLVGDDGTGDLGVIVDQAMRDGIVDAADIADIVREAREAWACEGREE